MVPAGREWTSDDARAARARHDARSARLARNERIAERKRIAPPSEKATREAAVAAALARARARRAAGAPHA
jgi:electron transport complex protein RnfB